MPPVRKKPGPCNPACTKVIKYMTGVIVPASIGLNLGPYLKVDGYRHINFFVRFSQLTANEPPVDLGVMFAFDAAGTLGTGRYVNLEANVAPRQTTNLINVSGVLTWHGNPWNVSAYVVRLPVMGPFAEVFAYNQATVDRTVDIWAYLVS